MNKKQPIIIVAMLFVVATIIIGVNVLMARRNTTVVAVNQVGTAVRWNIDDPTRVELIEVEIIGTYTRVLKSTGGGRSTAFDSFEGTAYIEGVVPRGTQISSTATNSAAAAFVTISLSANNTTYATLSVMNGALAVFNINMSDGSIICYPATTRDAAEKIYAPMLAAVS